MTQTEEVWLDPIAEWMQALSQPARLKILLALSKREACVCHLKASLGFRQAYLSQQLKVLRQAGLVSTRRDRKHIYYSLTHPELMDLVDRMGTTLGYPEGWLDAQALEPATGCTCPHCRAEKIGAPAEWVPLAE